MHLRGNEVGEVPLGFETLAQLFSREAAVCSLRKIMRDAASQEAVHEKFVHVGEVARLK